jgi:hypothetical protein
MNILIATTLEEAPFQSVRSLASGIKYPGTTVWQYLHAADYAVHHLPLVSHMLTPVQKSERGEIARKLKKCCNQPSIEVAALSWRGMSHDSIL